MAIFKKIKGSTPTSMQPCMLEACKVAYVREDMAQVHHNLGELLEDQHAYVGPPVIKVHHINALNKFHLSGKGYGELDKKSINSSEEEATLPVDMKGQKNDTEKEDEEEEKGGRAIKGGKEDLHVENKEAEMKGNGPPSCNDCWLEKDVCEEKLDEEKKEKEDEEKECDPAKEVISCEEITEHEEKQDEEKTEKGDEEKMEKGDEEKTEKGDEEKMEKDDSEMVAIADKLEDEAMVDQDAEEENVCNEKIQSLTEVQNKEIESELEARLCSPEELPSRWSSLKGDVNEIGMQSSEISTNLCDIKYLNDAKDTNSKQACSTSNAATSGSSSSSATGHTQSARAPGGGGDAGGKSGGDEQPPRRGPPSRLPSQCEVSDYDEQAETKKKADQFGDHYCQERVGSLTLPDDDEPPDDPQPKASVCTELSSFREACSEAKQGGSHRTDDGNTFLRKDVKLPMIADQHGRYRPGKEYSKFPTSLGEGSVGSVFRATCRRSKQEFAVKEISLKNFEPQELNGLLLLHETIVTMYGAHCDGTVVSVFQQLVQGTVPVLSALEWEWLLQPDDVLQILYRLLTFCVAIHGLGVTYGDFHEGNILTTENFHIYMIDWGRSEKHEMKDEKFRKAEAEDIKQAIKIVKKIYDELLRQRSPPRPRNATRELNWEDEASTVDLLGRFLNKAREMGNSGKTVTAAMLLADLNNRLKDNNVVIEEIANGERPALRPTERPSGVEEVIGEAEDKVDGMRLEPLVEEPVDEPSSGDLEGAVGGSRPRSLQTNDSETDPFVSSSSTFDRNLSDMEYLSFQDSTKY